MKYLITSTLLSSWDWSLKLDKLDEFKTTLKREPIPDNEAMRAGREFEDYISRLCQNPETVLSGDKQYDSCVRQVAGIVKGGVWQVKGHRSVTVGDNEFLLYGRLDVLRGPRIFDIKFTKKYECPKYQNSPQHKMYLMIFNDCVDFQYIISDGSQVYTEHYSRGDEETILTDISDFMSWLSVNKEYEELFFKHWKSW